MSFKPFTYVLHCFCQSNASKDCFWILTLLLGALLISNVIWQYQTLKAGQQQTLKALTEQAAYRIHHQLDTLVIALHQIEGVTATHAGSAFSTENAQIAAIKQPFADAGFYLLSMDGMLLHQADTQPNIHQAMQALIPKIALAPEKIHILLLSETDNTLYIAKAFASQTGINQAIGVLRVTANGITTALQPIADAKPTIPPLQLVHLMASKDNSATQEVAWQFVDQLPTLATSSNHYPQRIGHIAAIPNTSWAVIGFYPTLQWAMFTHIVVSSLFILPFLGIYLLLWWQHKDDKHAQQQALQVANKKLTAQVEDSLADLHHQIAEREQAEKALRQNETRLRGIIETAADCILTLNEQGVIESYNHACEEMFLYLQQDAVNQPLSLLLPHFKSVSTHSFNAIHIGSLVKNDKDPAIRHETEGLRQDGEHFPVEFVVSEFQSQEKVFFSGIIRDITDRKALEKLLQSSIKKLQTTVEQRTRDVKKLTEKLDIHQRLSNWHEGQVTSQLTGMGSLRERDTERFEYLLNIYVDLLEDYLEAAAFNKSPKRSTIIAFANRLGDVGGGPKDVLDIHLSCIDRKTRDPQVNNRRIHSYTVEGRLLVIEIMGHLVDYYRLHPIFSG